MKTKNKSFLEDTFILFIIAIIIYAIYSFFFSSNENEQKEEPKVVIEEITQNPLLSETIESKMKNLETLGEEEILENEIIEQDPVLNQVSEQINIETEKDSIIDEKEEKTEIKVPVKKDDLTSLFENIEQNIYKNIENNPLKNNEFLNIRLTILKDGKYQQLILIDGDKEYFNKIKPSISKAFPVKINESIKGNFPRYFRMKIENK